MWFVPELLTKLPEGSRNRKGGESFQREEFGCDVPELGLSNVMSRKISFRM